MAASRSGERRRLTRSVLLVPVMGAACWWGVLRPPAVLSNQAETTSTATQTEAATPAREKISVGGVMRPRSDVEKPLSPIDLERQTDLVAKGAEAMRKMGKQPAIAADANSTAARLYATLKNGGSHTFGLHAEAPPFDLTAFKSDPQKYAEQFAPNRVYQTAQPGPGIPPLAPASSSTQSMVAGESVRLPVKTRPGYPVTYVSLDLGTFQNRLNAITDVADDQGIAAAIYTATPGTVYRSHVLVGSPGASGQVSFELQIRLPSN